MTTKMILLVGGQMDGRIVHVREGAVAVAFRDNTGAVVHEYQTIGKLVEIFEVQPMTTVCAGGGAA